MEIRYNDLVARAAAKTLGTSPYYIRNGTQYTTQKFKATYSKSHTRHSTDAAAVRTGVEEMCR